MVVAGILLNVEPHAFASLRRPKRREIEAAIQLETAFPSVARRGRILLVFGRNAPGPAVTFVRRFSPRFFGRESHSISGRNATNWSAHGDSRERRSGDLGKPLLRIRFS